MLPRERERKMKNVFFEASIMGDCLMNSFSLSLREANGMIAVKGSKMAESVSRTFPLR